MSLLDDIELPSVYLDDLVEDAAPATTGKTPVLINLAPEAGETRVPATTNIQLDLATLDVAGTVDLAATSVYVDGVLAFQAGTFQTGFTGAGSAYSNPQADVLRITIDPITAFASEATVSVRVVSQATGDAGVLDQTYTFAIADTTAPVVATCAARDLKVIRVTFDEPVLESSASSTASALNAANYTIARLGDYLTPIVSVNVVSVAAVNGSTVDLTADIPLTPGGYYRLAINNVQDLSGNAANTTIDFYGWAPPTPDNRDFDLYKKLPGLNRQEDITLDLKRFVLCIQEVANLLLWDVDRFTDILDPDLADEEFVDAMLDDLGNPFAFTLALVDKRRLVQTLVNMYRLKGTAVGIKDVVRFFLGLDIDISPYNGSTGQTLVLGESELGVDWTLGTGVSALLYSFEVVSGIALTQTQRDQIGSIVEFMKPAHTHYVRLVEPVIPEVLDPWELGLSELGYDTFLH